MPSGIELTGLGAEARCMQCHQGRESKVSVDADIEAAGVDDDTVSEDLGFANIHYYAAAATKYGTEAKGGYEYDGNTYDAFFVHVEGYEACQDCHDSHTLEVKVDECAACHTDVSTVEDLRDIRMAGSLVDYDGDGDLEEGVAGEIGRRTGSPLRSHPGLRQKRWAAPSSTTPAPIRTSSMTPASGFGIVDAGLLRGAYNYQVSLKDPGAYAHGGKYIIELMYDSIEDLNWWRRVEPAHGSTTATSPVPRRRSATGTRMIRRSCRPRAPSATRPTVLPTFLAEGVNISTEPANGFLCSTCHTDFDLCHPRGGRG